MTKIIISLAEAIIKTKTKLERSKRSKRNYALQTGTNVIVMEQT